MKNTEYFTLPDCELDKSDMEILERQTPQTLAVWWKTLNCLGWIDEFGEPEPHAVYDSMPAAQTRRNRLMRWISERVSDKLISRVWNSKKDDDEFAQFWEARKEKSE